MGMSLNIKCRSCGRIMETEIKPDSEKDYFLSDAIEDTQVGFYCMVDKPTSMKINCVCGHDFRLHF